MRRFAITIPLAVLIAAMYVLIAHAPAPAAATDGIVVLLHGLGRSDWSMKPLERGLEEEGYRVVNLDYPSARHPIEELSRQLGEELAACCAEPGVRVHFVTHSMGGILVRQFLAENDFPRLGRVVMLSPPNQGSELADLLNRSRGLRRVSGPSRLQLGTDAESLPNRLGPAGFEVGIIAGNRTWNPVFSGLIPGDDDGMVAVERMKLEGMADFIVLPHTHTFIMRSDEVLAQALHFLREGRFDHEAAVTDDAPATP